MKGGILHSFKQNVILKRNPLWVDGALGSRCVLDALFNVCGEDTQLTDLLFCQEQASPLGRNEEF